MGDETTTIRISREVWSDLHAMKGPGMSHDDVLRKLLDKEENAESELTEQDGYD